VVTTTGDPSDNLCGGEVIIDHSGYEVDLATFLRVLEGRYPVGTPPSRRFDTDEHSDVLLYMTGHGGEGFFKFQDVEFLYAEVLAMALRRMRLQRRYGRLLLLLDTCHAESMCTAIDADDVVCVAASTSAEDSVSHHRDSALGIDVIDTFTYEMLLGTRSLCSGPAADVSVHRFFFGSVPGKQRLSRPAFRSAVNKPAAIFDWRMSDFVCERTV
jgi:phosphatidylinositol glycan class K